MSQVLVRIVLILHLMQMILNLVVLMVSILTIINGLINLSFIGFGLGLNSLLSFISGLLMLIVTFGPGKCFLSTERWSLSLIRASGYWLMVFKLLKATFFILFSSSKAFILTFDFALKLPTCWLFYWLIELHDYIQFFPKLKKHNTCSQK